MWEVREPAIVIDVQVGQHDPSHITGPYTQRAELWTDFRIAFDPKLHFPPPVRMEGPGGLKKVRPLTRVHDDHAFGVVNDPDIRW